MFSFDLDVFQFLPTRPSSTPEQARHRISIASILNTVANGWAVSWKELSRSVMLFGIFKFFPFVSFWSTSTSGSFMLWRLVGTIQDKAFPNGENRQEDDTTKNYSVQKRWDEKDTHNCNMLYHSSRMSAFGRLLSFGGCFMLQFATYYYSH